MTWHSIRLIHDVCQQFICSTNTCALEAQCPEHIAFDPVSLKIMVIWFVFCFGWYWDHTQSLACATQGLPLSYMSNPSYHLF